MRSYSSCDLRNQEKVSPQLIRSAGVEPRHIYDSVDNILAVVKKTKADRSGSPILLPFCHTMEARALGADIRPADDTAGPRPSSYTRASLENFPEVEIAQYTDAARLLQACGILSRTGESIIYQVSGPISILSCLMSLTVIFKAWHKSPEIAGDAFGKLRRMLLAYCRALHKSGVKYIAYADPAGAHDILGPKYTKLLTDEFTLPFLRELTADIGANLIVCPLTVAALAKTGTISESAENEGVFACACVNNLSGQPRKNLSFA